MIFSRLRSDSLSPQDEYVKETTTTIAHPTTSDSLRSSEQVVLRTIVEQREVAARPSNPDRSTQLECHPACQSTSLAQEETTCLTVEETACSPRSLPILIHRQHRPPQLELRASNGFTTLNTPEIRQCICHARSDDHTTVIQIPVDRRPALPPTPTTPFTMGNQPSTSSGSPFPEESAQRNGLKRYSRPVSRKSSFNVFKRVDSTSPGPRDNVTSVESIIQNDTQHALDELRDDGTFDGEGARYAHHASGQKYMPRDDSTELHSASTVTMTEERAEQPLSASSTIHNLPQTDESWVEEFPRDESDAAGDVLHQSSVENDRPPCSASLRLPIPSPLPEDSPHKYGLRDKMDTPEAEDPRQEIAIVKTRRVSSGAELFNEVRTLQSAASFLNGLSTARRRAESASAQQRSDAPISTSGTAQPSAPSTRTDSGSGSDIPHADRRGRRRWHNFKSSGFAYSRPLTFAQMSCFRNHARLLPTRNKHAPVECAVCHIDDDADHWTCSWCAIRMCTHCRKDFAERGLSALRERIRMAELGVSQQSADGSRESLE